MLTRDPAHRPAAAPSAPVLRRSPLRRSCACGGSPGADGECAACRRRRLARRPATGGGGGGLAPPIVREVLASAGRPLDAAARGFMEPRFGHSFAAVRVHTDGRAAASARAVAARAYTVGRHLVFGTGEYAPHTTGGRGLLAHELAHVVQQEGTGAPSLHRLAVGPVDDEAEREAERSADAVLRGSVPAPLRAAGAGARLRRWEQPPRVEGEAAGPAGPQPPREGEPAERFRNCDEAERTMISGHLRHARTWVGGALTILDNFLRGNVTPAEQRMVLTTYVLNLDPGGAAGRTGPPAEQRAALQEIGANLAAVRSDLHRIHAGLSEDLTYHCYPLFCRSRTLAHVGMPRPTVETEGGVRLTIPQQTRTIRICSPQWFQCGNFFKRVSALIHEVVHARLIYPGDVYEWEPEYLGLGWETARRNPDSLAVFNRQLYHLGRHGPGMGC
jgi:hypothetical protein